MEQVIIKTACEVFGYSEQELMNSTIKHNKTKCRMAIAYVMVQAKIEQKRIAELLDKHETTVSYYVSQAIDLVEYDKEFKNKVIQIMDRSLT